MVIMIVLNKFCSLTSINDNFWKQSLNIKYLLLISQRFTKVFINLNPMGAKESKQDTPGLEHIFKQIDTAGDGFITAQCL